MCSFIEMAALFQYVEILKLSLGTIGGTVKVKVGLVYVWDHRRYSVGLVYEYSLLSGTELQSIAMECLREVVIVSPQDVSNELRKDVSWLKVCSC